MAGPCSLLSLVYFCLIVGTSVHSLLSLNRPAPAAIPCSVAASLSSDPPAPDPPPTTVPPLFLIVVDGIAKSIADPFAPSTAAVLRMTTAIPSLSLVNRLVIATGVPPSVSGRIVNTASRSECQSVFSSAASKVPASATSSNSTPSGDWPSLPLHRSDIFLAGPAPLSGLFRFELATWNALAGDATVAGNGDHELPSRKRESLPDLRHDTEDRIDAMVATSMRDRLSVTVEPLRFAWFDFGSPDAMAHRHGTDSSEYRDAVNRTFAYVDEALRASATWNATVIVLSDHGHVRGATGGHGGSSDWVTHVGLWVYRHDQDLSSFSGDSVNNNELAHNLAALLDADDPVDTYHGVDLFPVVEHLVGPDIAAAHAASSARQRCSLVRWVASHLGMQVPTLPDDANTSHCTSLLTDLLTEERDERITRNVLVLLIILALTVAIGCGAQHGLTTTSSAVSVRLAATRANRFAMSGRSLDGDDNEYDDDDDRSEDTLDFAAGLSSDSESEQGAAGASVAAPAHHRRALLLSFLSVAVLHLGLGLALYSVFARIWHNTPDYRFDFSELNSTFDGYILSAAALAAGAATALATHILLRSQTRVVRRLMETHLVWLTVLYACSLFLAQAGLWVIFPGVLRVYFLTPATWDARFRLAILQAIMIPFHAFVLLTGRKHELGK